jgi:autotransporter passenger strand-loop-strand repeat protein
MTSAAFSPETAGTIVYTAEFGSPPDATELNVLSQFAQAQFAYGQQIGVMDPTVYAYEALGVALASTGANFQNTFGPAVDGDVQFLVDAYASVFGQPGSGAQIQQFSDQLNFFEGLYTAAGVFGSASNIDLLARGAVYGQMLGIEHENTPIGSPSGGMTFTAPPDQNNLVLNNGDVLNVNNHGTAPGTTVNSGGVVDVTDGGQANFTKVFSGGVINVNSGGQTLDTVLGPGGVVNVNAGGMASLTDIFGGVENVMGVSVGPTLHQFGVENVVAGGRIAGVLFEGGILQLSDPTQLSGMIGDEAALQGGAVIDFVNTNVTNFTLSGDFESFQLVLTYGNNQTITYHLTIPQNGHFSPNVALQADDHGGTNLIISGSDPITEAQSSMDVIGIQHQLEHPAV